MPSGKSASVHKKYGRSRHVKVLLDSTSLRAKVFPCTRMYSRLATCTSAALTASVYHDTECFRAQNIILRDKKSAYAHQCVSHTEVLLMRYVLYKHEMRSRTGHTAIRVCTELLRQHRLYGHRCDGRTKQAQDKTLCNSWEKHGGPQVMTPVPRQKFVRERVLRT